MQQHASEFAALDVLVAVVTFDRGPLAQAYVESTGCPFPLLVDEHRVLYHAYGMLRGRWQDIWGWRTWGAYGRELWRGRLPGRPADGTDTHQLGGDVLIDPEGCVRFVHVGNGPADRPSIETLLRVRRSAA